MLQMIQPANTAEAQRTDVRALPPPEFLEELKAYSAELESASPREIIQWAADKYYPKLTMATAFGPEGC